MQENATIDKSWDFLIKADKIDLRKVLSALYLIPSSRTKKELYLSHYKFDLEGEDIARKILSLCYESSENISYENFIKDIAFAFNKNISREISIEETEAALLKIIKENVLKEATPKELELISKRYNVNHQNITNSQETEHPNDLVEISKLLDINLFTNNDNDSFYNDHPLVAKCYRAVIRKYPRFISKLLWWLRFYIVDDSDNQTIQRERIEEPFWPMIWRHFKSFARFILFVVFICLILPICFGLILVLIPLVLLYSIRTNKLIDKEDKEFDHVQNLQTTNIKVLTILIVTLIYLRNKKNGTNLKDCIQAIEKRNERFNKEFVSMALTAFLYDDMYTNRTVGYVNKKTFIQVLMFMKDEISFPDYMIPILTDDIKQTLKILYRSINPERNQYYEKIYNEQTLIAEDTNLSVLMVDYQFPFTRIDKNTKFLKCERDIYDELNLMYLRLLMGYDSEDVLIDLKPGDTFDVIQIYDTDRIGTYKDYLSEGGKFVVVRTEAEIDRGTILSAVSDLQHMLGDTFSKQSGYVEFIRFYENLNDTEKYKDSVEGLINCVNYIQRIVHYYDGDIPTTIKNAEKEKCVKIADLLSEYINEWSSVSKQCFRTMITKGAHYQDASIDINRDLFFTSLDAIFSNAKRHGFSSKTCAENIVEIYTDLVNYQSTSMALISIRNNGKPFANDFTIDKYIGRGRFSKSSGHLGLGGYHVYSFAKANNGYLNIRNSDEWNVIIDILLPLNNQDIIINNEYNYDGCK